MYRKSKAEIVREEYPIEALLNKYSVERKGSSYQCPFHKGGKEAVPSAFVGKRGTVINKLCCNACYSQGARPYSVIDVYMHFENSTAEDAINALYSQLEAGKINVPEYVNKPSEVKIESYADALKNFTAYEDLEPRYKKRIDSFLETRKLYHAKEIIKANGYRLGIKSYIAPWGQKYNNKAFDFGTFMQSRADEGKGKTKKYNAGNIEPKLLKVNPSRTWFIVEGFTDALACAELGYNVIFISGANNWDKLKLRKANEYVLAFDNDISGVNVKNKLMEKFKGTGVSIKVFHELEKSSYKDMGEYVMNL
jgi:5S rRNA maturation endonuclease (ribonuclease M5)